MLQWVRKQLGEAEEGCVTVEVQKGFFEVAVEHGHQQGAATWLAESHKGSLPSAPGVQSCRRNFSTMRIIFILSVG
jgi:hypothetical protein